MPTEQGFMLYPNAAEIYNKPRLPTGAGLVLRRELDCEMAALVALVS